MTIPQRTLRLHHGRSADCHQHQEDTNRGPLMAEELRVTDDSEEEEEEERGG